MGRQHLMDGWHRCRPGWCGKGTLCGDTTGEAVCCVKSSRAFDRQRTRGLRTGAYVEDFGNTGISDVSGSPAMASGIVSSAKGIGVIGASLDVNGPSCW